MFSVNAVRLALEHKPQELLICQKVIRACTREQSLYKLYDFYGTSQCGQYRYEFTYELTKVSTRYYIGINILLLLFCDYFYDYS